MKFQKGNKLGNRFSSGNQPKNNGRKGKTVSEWIQELGNAKKIEYSLKITDQDGNEKIKSGKVQSTTTLNQLIATNLVSKAVNGDYKAVEIVLDRAEGKVPQSLNLGGQEDNPFISAIEIRKYPTNNTDDN